MIVASLPATHFLRFVSFEARGAMTSDTSDPSRESQTTASEPGEAARTVAAQEASVATPPPAPAPAAAAAAPAAPETARPAPKSPRAAIEPSEVPPPPRRRSKAARNPTIVFLNGLFSLLTLLVVGTGAVFFYGKQRFEAPGALTAPVVVLVPKNASTGAIADLLERNGVIADTAIFTFAAKFSNQFEKLKAGEYEFPPAVSIHEVLNILAEGRAVQHRITFPEGWSSEQIVRRLVDDQSLSGLNGRIAAIPEEGSLLPETYSYSLDSTTREQIIDQMRKAQERRLADIWAHRVDGLPLATPRDLVILASIVEKETSKADERPRVAAVFINRLKKGMRLQTDPTVLYGIYGGKAWLEGRTILRSDLDSPNPYNTYKIPGLPPGPICNPGRAAMEAVANPSRTNELYFVADGTGGHVFAETLEEHNRNVQRWRAIERGTKPPTDAGAPAPTATPAPVSPVQPGAQSTRPTPVAPAQPSGAGTRPPAATSAPKTVN